MNIERTIEFILQCQARAEVRMERAEARMDRMEARFDKEIAAINKLLRQGAKMMAETQRQLKELAAAQRATERSLQAFLESLRKGANGRR
jgi:septal ring factor EnvC (AmiA/AmiB activator)